jgi:hypothetical protein
MSDMRTATIVNDKLAELEENRHFGLDPWKQLENANLFSVDSNDKIILE